VSGRKRRSLALSLGVLAALAAAAAHEASGEAAAPTPAARGALQLDAPAPGALLRQGEPRVEVRGRAVAELFGADVVIALDASNSALLASGVDLDGDGVVGATREFADDEGRFVRSHSGWTSDADDSILLAEYAAADALLDALSARQNRVGLLTYTAQPRARAPVGPPERARAALSQLRVVEDRSGTDLARAMRAASAMLDDAADGGAQRPRALLLCSDGEPSAPPPAYMAKRRALREAARLAERQVALYVLAFGVAHLRSEEGKEELDFLRELAAAAGGVLVEVDAPRGLLDDLPPAAPRPRSLEIANLTTGAAADSLRLAPDGGFAAWLPLAPGRNELEVRALWQNGRSESLRRVVHFEAGDAGATRELR
jgi:hypothetical protein